MKAKSLLCLVMSMALLSLTGCGQSRPDPGDVEGYDPGEEYLSIWVHCIEDTNEGGCYRDAVNRFNEKFNGKYFADIEFIPRNDSGGGYSDKINASVMSGDLPDVLTVDGPNIATYASNGIIQPLAPLTDEEKGEYLQTIIDQGTYNGELYALGGMESTVGLYCNRDILEKAGVEIPDAKHPWTFSEFLDVLEKIKPVTDSMKGYALDMTFPIGEETIFNYAPFFWSSGQNIVSEDGLQVDGIFNASENVSTIEYFQKLLAGGYMSQVPISNLFESGRAAFKFCGPWELNTIYTSYPDVNLGVAPYIVGDNWDGGRYAPSGSWAFAASTKTDNIEGATELVKCMTSVESGIALWKTTKNLPSTFEAYEKCEEFKNDENCKALYDQLREEGHPRPKTPVYPQVSTSFQQVLENCVLNGADPQAELDKAVERIDAKLKRYTVK